MEWDLLVVVSREDGCRFLVLRSFWKEEGGAGGFGICVLGWVEGLGKLVAIDGNDFREFDRNKKFVVSVYIEPGASLF